MSMLCLPVAAAEAEDGVIEIDQACADAGTCSEINSSSGGRSFVLTGPFEGIIGIGLTDVKLDLNGFEIKGRIFASANADGLTVMNGVVTSDDTVFPAIRLRSDSVVRDVRVSASVNYAIRGEDRVSVIGCVVRDSNRLIDLGSGAIVQDTIVTGGKQQFAGIWVGSGLVTESIAIDSLGNAGGIRAGSSTNDSSIIKRNILRANGSNASSGIGLAGNLIVESNVVSKHGDIGMSLSVDSGYLHNVVSETAAGAESVDCGQALGPNVLDVPATPCP